MLCSRLSCLVLWEKKRLTGGKEGLRVTKRIHQEEEAPIILISDDESIGRGSKTKFNESDDYSTIPIKKYPRKRTTFRNAIKKLNFCDCCLYETRNKSHFNRHLNSATHKENRQIQSGRSEELARNTSRWLDWCFAINFNIYVFSEKNRHRSKI